MEKKSRYEKIHETVWTDRENYYFPDIVKKLSGDYNIEFGENRVEIRDGLRGLIAFRNLMNHVIKENGNH